jgi:RNA polymerase sigma-70 factor (ECF subfamily)
MTPASLVVLLRSDNPPPGPKNGGRAQRDAAEHDAERDDAELVTRIRAGDQAAFESVFHAYTRQLCAFAFRYVGSREAAAELVQDVFLWIWQQRDRWEVHGAVRSYLYRAVRNRALDFLKHEGVERRWAQEVEAGTRDGMAVGQGPTPPDRALDIKMLAAALEGALADVPERRREIFLLRWKHGMSYAEIGVQLGISPKTVENQLARVLHYLRGRLAP